MFKGENGTIQAVSFFLTCHYNHTLENFSCSKQCIYFSQATDTTQHIHQRLIWKFTIVEEGINSCSFVSSSFFFVCFVFLNKGNKLSSIKLNSFLSKAGACTPNISLYKQIFFFAAHSFLAKADKRYNFV